MLPNVPRALLICLALAAISLFVLLGSTPLVDADEGRNAEVAREMAETNDYLIPRIGGMPYLDKPVVYFAAEAAAMEVLGPTELAARLPAAIFTLLTALLIFRFARRELGDTEAVVATIAFLTMPLTIAFARTVIFDSALTFFMVLAVLSWHRAIEERVAAKAEGGGQKAEGAGRGRGVNYSVLAWAAMALGVLTKGPVAILVPLLVVIPYGIRRKAARAIWSFEGLLVFIAIIAPWVWAMSQVIPEFLRYVLVTETAERMATKALKRTGPPWYFIPYLIGGALPWTIALISAPPREKTHAETRWFALMWIALPFLFFSISQSKRPQYILPLMPAVALLMAMLWSSPRVTRALRAAAGTWLFLGVVLLAFPFIPVKMAPEIAAGARTTALALGVTAVAGGALALAFARRREIALVAVALPLIAMPVVTDPVMQGVAKRRSAKAFVAQLEPQLKPETEVVGINHYTGSLQFYLERPVTVVTGDAEEFTSNYILRRYDRFASDPASPVKRPATFRLDRADVYVVRPNDKATRGMLDRSDFRVIAESSRHVAYAAR